MFSRSEIKDLDDEILEEVGDLAVVNHREVPCFFTREYEEDDLGNVIISSGRSIIAIHQDWLGDARKGDPIEIVPDPTDRSIPNDVFSVLNIDGPDEFGNMTVELSR